jgi:hypothetical protein
MINKQKLGNYVKREAYNEIKKTKNINRRDKYHKTSNAETRREEKEKEKKEENSSSGVDDSDEKME